MFGCVAVVWNCACNPIGNHSQAFLVSSAKEGRGKANRPKSFLANLLTKKEKKKQHKNIITHA